MKEKQESLALVIDHIAVYVQELGSSTRFYKEVMGLQEVPEPFKDGRHAWFQVSQNCQLHLISGASAKAAPHINNHLAFTTSSVEAFIKNLKHHGYEYVDARGIKNKIHIRPDGIQQIFFQDPDGYWLEVNNDIS